MFQRRLARKSCTLSSSQCLPLCDLIELGEFNHSRRRESPRHSHLRPSQGLTRPIQTQVSTSPNESEFAALARKMLKGVHYKWIYLIRVYLDMIKVNCFAAHPEDDEEAQKLHLRTVLYALQSILRATSTSMGIRRFNDQKSL
jgi:hypothetical protein